MGIVGLSASKWRTAVWVASGALLLAACQGREGRADAAASPETDGWTRPPSIQTASVDRGALVVTGVAEPNGRVVLRTETGVAYGTAADEEGLFQLRAPLSPHTLLLRSETQVGREAAASADRLLVVAGGRGPIALLRSGSAARRLDGTPTLGSVDTDGRVVLASGFAPGPVTVEAGGQVGRAAPDSKGHWSLMTNLPPDGGDIRVGTVTSTWPGAGTLEAAGGPRAERAGQGWRVMWSTDSGAAQSTWLPDGDGSFTHD